jgi:hypothetical protein
MLEYKNYRQLHMVLVRKKVETLVVLGIMQIGFGKMTSANIIIMHMVIKG